MGNTPSKEPQRRSSHKLSKPRVASFQTSAPAPPSGSDLKRSSEPVQAFLSIPYSATSSNSDDDDQQGSDKSTPLMAPKAQRRLSLFRSKSSQEPPDSRKSRRNTIIGSPSVSFESDPAQVARANSVSTHHATDQSYNNGQSNGESWPAARSRASWAYDLSSYEAQRVLSLVQDRPMPLPRSQTSTSLSSARFEDIPRRRASMFVQPQSAPISRSNSELSLHPPMRRRSLIQTPGVATRPHPGPATTKSRRSSLRHSHPPTPNLSRQPSTHFEESDSDCLHIAPLRTSLGANNEVSGVATPRDADYSITGTFKFGTLRITNGDPVPTPDAALSLSNAVEQAKFCGKTQDYFTRETESKDSVTSGGHTEHALESVQCGLTSQFLEAEAAGDRNLKLEAVGEETTPSLSILAHKGQGTSDFQLSPDNKVQKQPSSPLMTQSRQAAVDDDLFEDDTNASALEVLDVRVDLSARSSTRQAIDSAQTSEVVNRSDSGFISNSKSDSAQSHSSLAKADSGYSSNVSLRSLRRGKKSATSEEVAGRNSVESDQGCQRIQRSGSQKVLEIQIPNPVAQGDHAVDTPQSDKAPTPPPKDDYVLKQVSRTPSGTTDVRANPTMPGRMRRKPLHQQLAAIDTSQTLENPENQELVSPNAIPLSPASVHSDGSSSSLSIANSSHRPRRLQRLLSLRNSHFTKQTYTVHETHSIDRKIPSIPQEVEDKLRERTGLYPMTTKRLALKSQMSKETLKTILSVGSLEYDDGLSTPTSFEQEDGEGDKTPVSGDVKESCPKQTFDSMQSSSTTDAASIMPSKQAIARKPVPAREPQKCAADNVGKDDLLSVAIDSTSRLSASGSLSSSAYDSAAGAGPPGTIPSRSLSMNTGHDHVLQTRTYSLVSRHSSLPINVSSSKTMPEKGEILPKHQASPPISMVTRTHFRTPPPRSPSRPQGPAVRRKESLETVSWPVSYSPAPAPGHHGSVTGNQPDKTTSAPQLHANTWDSSSSRSSVGSQTPSPAHSRQNSISSVRSDFVRESRGFQMYGQHASSATLKHQSSLEGIGRNQLHGVYVPHSPQHGPASVPQSQLDNCHGLWNFDNGRPMSGQLPWGRPPHVPREHRRNMSGGNHLNRHTRSGASHTPYRILHSYNSPAYRNAPIWG